MSSRMAAKQHLPAGRKDAVPIPISTRPAARFEAAVNDDNQDDAKFSFTGDPLLGMAIGTGILFGVLAVLLAFA